MVDFLLEWVLTLLIVLPLAGAAVTAVIKSPALAEKTALTISVLQFAMSLFLIIFFEADSNKLQFGQLLRWFPEEVGIQYIVGVDGVSLLLVLLTTALCPLVIFSSFSSIEKNKQYFLALFLFLESAMVGALVACDIVLFYVFWEAMLIPMYFIIGVWGGKERIYATTKFFIYTVIGSLLMLVAFVYLYYTHGQRTGIYTSNIVELYKTAALLPLDTQIWLFAATMLAFGIKVPMFPLHTWLPDAHVQAPTPGSVILAGVLLKMGTYGIIRFGLCLFPKAAGEASDLMIVLGIVGIIYGALVAWRQTDIKKLVAYSSVSHMGFIVIGLFSQSEEGLNGALYQMVNHGLATGALFLLIGAIYERRHTRDMAAYGGLASVMPRFAILFVTVTMGAVALPSTGSFIGEWLILFSAFKVDPVFGLLTGTGVILGAIYMLWLVLKVVWGPITKEENHHLTDLCPRETFIIGTLAFLLFITGFASKPILAHAQPTLNRVVQTVITGLPFETQLVENVTKGHLQRAHTVPKSIGPSGPTTNPLR